MNDNIITVTTDLTWGEVADIDELAAALDVTRSSALRTLLRYALDGGVEEWLDAIDSAPPIQHERRVIRPVESVCAGMCSPGVPCSSECEHFGRVST